MLNGHKFACVLAARAGSRRLKGKNLAVCAGKPLWQWTEGAVQAAGIFDSRIITTDIDALYRPFRDTDWLWATRPEELAGADVHIADVMQWMAERDYVDHEYLCLVSPTNPLRTGAHIRDAAKLLLKEKADAVVAVAPCHPSQQNMSLEKNARLCILQHAVRMPDEPILEQTYRLTGSIVIAKTELWAERAHIYNELDSDTVGYVMPKYDIDIDTKEDLFAAEAIIEWQRKRRMSLKSSMKSVLRGRSSKRSQE